MLPPNAVLYLLHLNKKWGDNKSSMEDYFDFDKLRAARGLQTIPMNAFLATIARNGLLNTPLPNNDSELIRKPLWDYLDKACYQRPWSPGKLYIGFNISSVVDGSVTDHKVDQNSLIGDFRMTDPRRLEAFALQSKLLLLYAVHFSYQKLVGFVVIFAYDDADAPPLLFMVIFLH